MVYKKFGDLFFTCLILVSIFTLIVLTRQIEFMPQPQHHQELVMSSALIPAGFSFTSHNEVTNVLKPTVRIIVLKEGKHRNKIIKRRCRSPANKCNQLECRAPYAAFSF